MATTTKCLLCNTDSNNPYCCDTCGEILDDSTAWWNDTRDSDDDWMNKEPDDIEDWNNDYLTEVSE
jgi:hypothetical protein